MLNSKKKALLATVIFFTVFLFTTLTIVREKEKVLIVPDVIVADSPIVFYYGYNCPHCELVEKYLQENDVAAKVKFSKKEVYKNKANAEEAMARAAECGIKPEELGVPFLWDGEKCYIGDQKIIDYFKNKAQESGESVPAADAASAVQTSTDGGNPDAETQENPADADATLYFSEGCPHCQIVEEYITANRIGEKFKMSRKEVNKTAENRAEIIARETDCGIAPEEMAVPMLYAQGKCYLGDEEIINFFKEKSNEE